MPLKGGNTLNTTVANNVSAKPKRYVITKKTNTHLELVPTAGNKKPIVIAKKEALAQARAGMIEIVGLTFGPNGRPTYNLTNQTQKRAETIAEKVYHALEGSVTEYLKDNPIVTEVVRDETKKARPVLGYKIEWFDSAKNQLQTAYYTAEDFKNLLLDNKYAETINYYIKDKNAQSPRITERHKNFQTLCDSKGQPYNLANFRAYMLEQIKNSTQTDSVIAQASELSNGPTVHILPSIPKQTDPNYTTALEKKEQIVKKFLQKDVCLMVQTEPTKGTIKTYLGTTNLAVLEKIGYSASTYAVHNLAQKFLQCSKHNGSPYNTPNPINYRDNLGTYQRILSASLRGRLSHTKDPVFELSTSQYGCYIGNVSAIITLGYAKDAQKNWNELLEGNFAAGTNVTIDGQSYPCEVSTKMLTTIKDTIEKRAKIVEEIGNYLLSPNAAQEIWDACKNAVRQGAGVLYVANMGQVEFDEFKKTVEILGHMYKNGGFK